MDRESACGKTATSRRRFLAGLAVPAAAALLPTPARAALAPVPERTLRLHSRPLGEEVRAAYFAGGRYDPRAMAEVGRLLRDKRTGEATGIDPALLDLLWEVQREVAPHGSLEVVCGYRSPETNARLRRVARGVARNSYHMYGKAVDLRVPGVPLARLHRVALDLGRGGIGHYPRAGFVHLDTGPARTWGPPPARPAAGAVRGA